MNKKTVMITGGSSGIGACTAALFSKAGWCVYELSRRNSEAEGIRHISCDVTDPGQIEGAVMNVISETGRLDCVVNCAGFGISGAIEFTDIQQAKALFDVNFFGMVSVNNACIPHLRKTKGRIINISSVAAMASIPFQSFYSASKAAVNSYTLALANELKESGIRVCAVMPGDTATGFTAARLKSTEGDQLYQGKISRSVGKMEHDELSGMSPEAVGNLILRIAEGNSTKPLYTVGIQYKLVNLLLKILPSGLSNYIIGKMYG